MIEVVWWRATISVVEGVWWRATAINWFLTRLNQINKKTSFWRKWFYELNQTINMVLFGLVHEPCTPLELFGDNGSGKDCWAWQKRQQFYTVIQRWWWRWWWIIWYDSLSFIVWPSIRNKSYDPLNWIDFLFFKETSNIKINMKYTNSPISNITVYVQCQN